MLPPRRRVGRGGPAAALSGDCFQRGDKFADFDGISHDVRSQRDAVLLPRAHLERRGRVARGGRRAAAEDSCCCCVCGDRGGPRFYSRCARRRREADVADAVWGLAGGAGWSVLINLLSYPTISSPRFTHPPNGNRRPSRNDPRVVRRGGICYRHQRLGPAFNKCGRVLRDCCRGRRFVRALSFRARDCAKVHLRGGDRPNNAVGDFFRAVVGLRRV
mmetsp:Transcript_8502/g.27997  ORF Transcript_8502/g.27997 Transcript_8502/m.27997 type:complete len:217 (-) Transcript_8502:418-1068(-)